MKKIGKNTKLYLIGMIIGGITLGITTVIADTIINSTSVAYKTTTVKAALDELYDIADFKEEVKDMLYPVGSIYISVSGTNPSELFGGTWTSFGMGRTLLGVGKLSSQLNSYTEDGIVETNDDYWHHIGEVTGGAREHTLSVSQLPPHAHTIDIKTSAVEHGGLGLTSSYLFTDRVMVSGESISTGVTGNGNPIRSMPPYITVYMWKRTA